LEYRIPRLLVTKDIAHASYCMNKFILVVFIYAVAETADKNIDNIGLGIEMEIPDFFQNHGFGNGSAHITHHIFQQGKLPGLKINGDPVSYDLPGQQIQGKIPHTEPRCLGDATGSADQGLYSHQKFRKSKGLDQVIVGPDSKPSSLSSRVSLAVSIITGTCLSASWRQFPAQCYAVHARQHEVQDNDVIRLGQLPGADRQCRPWQNPEYSLWILKNRSCFPRWLDYPR